MPLLLLALQTTTHPSDKHNAAHEHRDSSRPERSPKKSSYPFHSSQKSRHHRTHTYTHSAKVDHHMRPIVTSFFCSRRNSDLHHRCSAPGKYIKHAAPHYTSRLLHLQPTLTPQQRTATLGSTIWLTFLRIMGHSPSRSLWHHTLPFFCNRVSPISRWVGLFKAHVQLVTRTCRNFRKRHPWCHPNVR